MPGHAFLASHPAIKPPAQCITNIVPLPPIIPGLPPPQFQGYAHWKDMDPLIPLDAGIYITMARRGTDYFWSGSASTAAWTFVLELTRTAAPNTWDLELRIEDYYAGPESYWFRGFKLDLDKNWASGLLTYVHVPGYDFRLAEVAR